MMNKSKFNGLFVFFMHFFVISILLVSTGVRGWYDVGHMVAAQITWQNMSEPARKEASRLLKILEKADPPMTDFVQASTWFDEQKGRGLSIFSSYHFIDNNYVVDPPGQLPAYNQNNAVKFCTEAIKTLRSERSSDFAKALMLRGLMHVMTDLFQPMHVISRVSKEAPHGDHGGTTFRIKPVTWEKEQVTSLHRLWDAGVTTLPKIRWFDSDWKTRTEQLAKDVQRKVNINKLPKLPADNPQAWANHSYRIATDFAYVGMKFNEEVSSRYLQEGGQIALEQLVLVGLLQGELLNGLLSNSNI